MGHETPASRNGTTALMGHQQDDRKSLKQVFANAVGQLEAGTSLGKVSFTRNANGRISSIITDYPRDGGVVTKTRTITRNANGRILTIEEAV
jgi:hypothetical protein